MSSKLLVLIIEDERNISDILATTLETQHYKVIQSHTGVDGLSLIASLCPDVILLDLGLPDIDGLEIIRKVRTWSMIPIIVISARSQETEKVAALDLGADDYLSKPYGSFELLARIRTAVRHSHKSNTDGFPKDPICISDLTIYFEKRKFFVKDTKIRLTPIEFKLVSLLAHNAGKVMTYSSIIKQIWGPFADTDNLILRVNMANIRRKIEPNPADPKYILTELGIGYRMIEDDEI